MSATLHRLHRLAGATAALALLAAAPAAVQAQDSRAAREVYTCIDASGRRLTSDRPIPECLDREQRVLDGTGTERRRIGPALSELERAEQEAQRRREVQERARIAEERRRERALTARYPDEAAHQAERSNALTQVDEVIAVARQRIVDVGVERKRLNAELEFYQGDASKAPVTLQRQLHENDEAVREQQRFIAAQEQEKRRIGQRFDAELVQLRQLWAAQRAAAEKWTAPGGGGSGGSGGGGERQQP